MPPCPASGRFIPEKDIPNETPHPCRRRRHSCHCRQHSALRARRRKDHRRRRHRRPARRNHGSRQEDRRKTGHEDPHRRIQRLRAAQRGARRGRSGHQLVPAQALHGPAERGPRLQARLRRPHHHVPAHLLHPQGLQDPCGPSPGRPRRHSERSDERQPRPAHARGTGTRETQSEGRHSRHRPRHHR